MDPNIRTHDIFEDIPGYKKPPLVPIPEYGDFSSLEYLGYQSRPLSNSILKSALAITGFRAFLEELKHDSEPILRRCNLRARGMFSPIFSATLALKDDPRQLDPIQRAATLIFGAKSLHDDLWSARLPQDMYKDEPLEMGQYPNLFSTSLVIEGPLARLFKSTSTTQLTVLVGGRIYVLETGELGLDCDMPLLMRTLEHLRLDASASAVKNQLIPAGVLTSADDFTTVKSFSQLIKSETNRESLNRIRHSFLTICLDLDSHPVDYAEAARLAHGSNFENRWNHASFQIVVFGNARACALFNFNAYLDGNTMMRSGAELHKRAANIVLPSSSDNVDKGLVTVKELAWEIPAELLQKARADVEAIVDDQRATFEIPRFGRDKLNALGAPAIPTFILALQLACNNLHGKTVNIIQMMSMTKYRCMDLTSASVTTPQVSEFVAANQDSELEGAQFAKLFQEAVDSQIQRSRDARKSLSYDKILGMFTLWQKGFRRGLTLFVMGLSLILLRVFRMSAQGEADVIVSHPEIYPEIPVIGRPGIRLPYARYFGLHYQIMAEKTVITMMPGVNWQVSNAEFISELAKQMENLLLKLEDTRSSAT